MIHHVKDTVKCQCGKPAPLTCDKCGRPICKDCREVMHKHVDGHLLSTENWCLNCKEVYK